MFPSGRPARGFATTVIVAILAMLAVLGTSLVVISMTQQTSTALDLQGVRAYSAARGGLEWGLNRLLLGGTPCAGVGVVVHGTAFNYAGNLDGYRVVLACEPSIHEEAAGNVTMYVLTATACNDTAGCPTATNPPPATYVERQLRVTAGNN